MSEFKTMSTTLFSLTSTEQNAGWELKYSIKTGAHCEHTSLTKDLVINKNRRGWSVSISGKDRFVNDTDELGKKTAFELAHTLMNINPGSNI